MSSAPGTKVYLSARFQRRAEMLEYSVDLATHFRFKMTSRWVTLEPSPLPPDQREIWADINVQDLLRSDLLIFFSETPSAGYLTGGRHVEYGMALAANIPIFVIGDNENLFHFTTKVPVKHFNEYTEFRNFVLRRRSLSQDLW